MASAGNSAGALAAYAAAAGIEAHIFMPRGASPSNRRQCIAYGARLTELDGGLEDCLHRVAEGKKRMGWLDLSSQQEPFRLEGDKTIGCEIAQQLQWKLPHAILGFAGGGRALLAAWKAFGEMEELGWIGKERPQMVAVEVDGRHASPQPSAIILEILRQSGGRALVVSEQEALAARDRWARVEGFWAAPAGAAALAAYSRLRGNGCFAEQDIVVLLNPASPLKYPEPTPEAGPGARPSRQIGGIIGPY